MTWKLGSYSTARKAGSRQSFRCESELKSPFRDTNFSSLHLVILG
jgi:hypothetical protein